MSAVGTVSARVNHLSFRNCSKTWARSKYLQSQRGCAPGGATGIATGAARRNRVRRDVEATAEPPLTSARPDRKRSSRDRFDTSGALQTLARWLYVEDPLLDTVSPLPRAASITVAGTLKVQITLRPTFLRWRLLTRPTDHVRISREKAPPSWSYWNHF